MNSVQECAEISQKPIEKVEEMLVKLLKALKDQNDLLESELFAILGLLSLEKTDFAASKIQFMSAIDKNKYNRIAFLKFSELDPNQIDPVMYLEHIRFQLGENPLDIESALAFANYAQQLELYQVAADSFGYCSDLFKYLYPSEPLPSYVYLPWALNSYNTKRSPFKAIQIADQIREDF